MEVLCIAFQFLKYVETGICAQKHVFHLSRKRAQSCTLHMYDVHIYLFMVLQCSGQLWCSAGTATVMFVRQSCLIESATVERTQIGTGRNVHDCHSYSQWDDLDHYQGFACTKLDKLSIVHCACCWHMAERTYCMLDYVLPDDASRNFTSR
jgi:hypothetical protein